MRKTGRVEGLKRSGDEEEVETEVRMEKMGKQVMEDKGNVA